MTTRKLWIRRERLGELVTDGSSPAAAPSVFCTSALTFCDPVCEATTTGHG